MTNRLRILALAVAVGGLNPAYGDDDAQLQGARSYLQKHDYKAAIIELKNYIQLHPTNAEARMLIGDTYMKMGDGGGAAQAYEKARDLNVAKDRWIVPLGRAYLLQNDTSAVLDRIKPTDDLSGSIRAQIYGLQGTAYLTKGDTEKSQQSFDAALQLDPASTEALLGLALLEAQRQNFKKTAEYANRVLDRDPKNSNAQIVLGEAKRLEGDNTGAIDAFTKGLEIQPYDLRARLGRATAYLALGKAEEATKDITEIRRIAPKNPMGMYMQAVLNFQNGKLQEANDLLVKSASILPDYLPTKLLLGTVSFQQGNYETAERELGQFLAKVPKHVPAAKLLAATRMKRERPQDAIEALKGVEESGKSDAQFLSLLGSAYLQAKQFDLGNDYLSRAAEIDPKAGSIKAQLGLGQIASGHLDQAVTDLKSAVDLDPNLLQADVLLVLTYIQQKKFDEAIEAANKLRQKMQDDPLPQNLLGAAYMSKGEPDKATEYWRAALKLRPEYSPAALNIAKLELSRNNIEGAANEYKALLSHDAKNLTALLGLAQIEENRRDYDKMEKYLIEARDKNPQSPQVASLLSRLYLQKGRPMQALEIAREAQNNSPEDPGILQNLGVAQMANDQAASAVGTFRKLSNKLPGNPDYRHQLAQALFRAGDKTSALLEWRGLLKDFPNFLPPYLAVAEYDIQEKKFDDAMQLATDLKTLQPKAVVGYQMEGEIEFSRRQFRKALNAYAAAREIAPNAGLMRRVYQSHHLLGEEQEGINALEEWLKTNPKDLETWMLLALGYQNSGKKQEAVNAYEKAYELKPDNVVVENNLVWLYQEVGDKRALPMAEKLLAASENNPEIMDTVGWVYLQNGQTDKALNLLKDAAVHAPQQPQIRLHVAEALIKAGRIDEAKETLERLLRENASFPDRSRAEALLKSL